jgi:hypothetical protein
MTHFSPTSVAGCISNVECSVGGNLELRQTIIFTYLSCLQLTGNYRKITVKMFEE